MPAKEAHTAARVGDPRSRENLRLAQRGPAGSRWFQPTGRSAGEGRRVARREDPFGTHL